MATSSGLVRKITTFAACSLLATSNAKVTTKEPKVSPNLMATLQSADRYGRMTPSSVSGKDPVVGLKTYLFDDSNTLKYDVLTFTDTDFGRVGAQGDYFVDLYASYEMPTFWMERQNTNWLIYNPNVFVEVAAEGSGTLYLSVIEFTLKFKVMLGKYTPFDFQLAWDMDNKSRYCYSLSYFWEVFDLELSTEWHINECSFGLLGYLSNSLNLLAGTDYKDCSKRRYVPMSPIYEVTLLDQGDLAEDYIPWECNTYAELVQERTPADENGNDIDNPVGFDDLPEEEEEGEWSYDPQNVVIE